jgi:hypothetical protein
MPLMYWASISTVRFSDANNVDLEHVEGTAEEPVELYL